MLNLLSLPVILLAYFGFAGGWGWLYRNLTGRHIWLAGAYGLLVMLPASIALPVGLPWLGFPVILAVGVAILVARQPAQLPTWMFNRRIVYIYLLTELGLIFLWGMASSQVGIAAASGITLVVAGVRLAAGHELVSGRSAARSGRGSKLR